MEWENDFGERFDSEEEARDNARKAMRFRDYNFWMTLRYEDLLKIVLAKCPDAISDALKETEDRYFKFYYREVCEDEEEEEGN